jgi:glycosyltransferase involved in cell wall biosynthesis
MTDPTALVSVVIPTYNRPDFLRIALRSVVEQSYARLEIIVQDNASDVDLGPLIAEFADPRVTLYRNATNIGARENYLAGYRRCTGKYIATLNDDDCWRPDFVATLVAKLEADDDLVIAFCDHDIIDGEGRVDEAASSDTTRRWGRDLLRDRAYRPFYEIALIRRSICTASAALLRRDAFDFSAVPSEIGVTIDLYVSYLAARTGRGCYYVPQRLAAFRVHAHSLTTRFENVAWRIAEARAAIFYWDRFLRDPAIPRGRGYFNMKRGFNALIIVLGMLRQGDWANALTQLRDFLGRGYIRPSIFAYYLVYALRLHRLSA